MSREAKAQAGLQAHRPVALHGRLARRKGSRGFTAIEMAMVATVIAILALIVMPLFRNRVEEAKIAAAKADIASFMKAEILAHADTDYYFRLEDLDNVINNDPPAVPAGGITIETPPLAYVRSVSPKDPPSFTVDQWRAMSGTVATPKFRGPYVTITHALLYSDAVTNPMFQPLFRSISGFGSYSPIRDLNPSGGYLPPGDPGVFKDSPQNRIPVDPWGTPYLFFPPTEESSYNYASIFCLGADALPGDFNTRGAVPNTTPLYLRETGVIGTGDDLEVRF